MNRSIVKRTVVALLILLVSLPNAACTKEKAEALKSAAESFRDEAALAFGMTGEMIKQSVALPVDSKDDELKGSSRISTANQNEMKPSCQISSRKS